VETFLKILRFITYLLVVIILLGSSAFYTHPTYIKQKLSDFIPDFRQVSNFFRNKDKCEEFTYIAPTLNDQYRDYIWNSAYQKFGEPLKDSRQIKTHFQKGNLNLIESNQYYIIDTLYYSYAFLTSQAKTLLDDIGQQFQEKLSNTKLKNSKIHVTSLLRTMNSVKRLRRWNRNSLRISSHLHGTTFDLDYDNFDTTDSLSRENLFYLKETLAETLEELRKQKRCYVTYEVRQTCFHVVCRRK